MSNINHLEQFKLEQELRDHYDKRRGEGYMADVIFIRRGSSRKKPDIFTKRETYSFLQYLRAVMHWAKKSSGLSRPRIELLLYLQPLGIFKKRDFAFFCRIIEIHQRSLFAILEKGGWIELWRPAKKDKKQSALYKLSHKGDKLCLRIHKMCIGEEKIPEDIAMMDSADKVIDRYYLDVIKHMNKSKGL